MTQAERIYGGASRVSGENSSRFDDHIDDRLIGHKWRQETEPSDRRSWRHDTAKIAAYGWAYVDRFREWSRHRGAAASFQ